MFGYNKHVMFKSKFNTKFVRCLYIKCPGAPYNTQWEVSKKSGCTTQKGIPQEIFAELATTFTILGPSMWSSAFVTHKGEC